MEELLMVGSAFLWPGRYQERLRTSERQYARLVQNWMSCIGFDQTSYGTHFVLRT
jgi:hypothetical protein